MPAITDGGICICRVHTPPPPPCPTNALANEHFRSERNVLGPNSLGTGFSYRIDWVPNGVSNEHSSSDRIF